MTPPRNSLYYGDNLDILRRKVAAESVDLCYIDPPFNSKRNYFQIYNNQGSEDRAQAQAFVDTWNWGDEAVEGVNYILDLERLQPRAGDTRWTEQTVELIRGLEKVLGRGSLLAYLVHMTLRIVEIHRVLKPTGSFYLHCDPTASHYLKLVLDAVFCGQGGDFLNEVVWHYDGPQRPSKRNFGRKHDIILRYAKTRNFLAVGGGIAPLEKVTGADLKEYKRTADGRYYYDLPRGDYTDESIVRLDKEGRIRWTKSGKARVMFFLEADGEGNQFRAKQLHDVWSDLVSLGHAGGAEKLGYPTQKPEALLERIIRASSNEGDIVLDAYCGCGTTVAVAQRLNRRWIGIDITYQSISLILKRFADKYKADWPAVEATIKLDGVPKDIASAMALANRKDDKTRKEFEKWAVLTYSDNQARINDKKGADGGIDGIAYFLKDKDENGKAIFQVKSRPAPAAIWRRSIPTGCAKRPSLASSSAPDQSRCRRRCATKSRRRANTSIRCSTARTTDCR